MTMGIIKIGKHFRREDIEEEDHLEVGFSPKVEVVQSLLVDVTIVIRWATLWANF